MTRGFRKYKVRDYVPLYETVEAIESNADGTEWRPRGVFERGEFMRRFASCWIYSVMDFRRTRTTSVAFGRERPLQRVLFDQREG